MQAFTPAMRSQSRRLEGVYRPQQKQQGYTIVELSIAVAIAGVLLVSAIGLVRSVINTSRANDTATMLTRAVTKIEKSWAAQPTYVGVGLASVAATGAFDGLVITRNTATPPAVTGVSSRFNQSVAVSQPADIPGTGLNRGYVITLAGVPTGVCSDLVTAAASGGIRGIVVSPESAIGTAPTAPSTMTESSGVITAPTGGVVVLDGSLNTPNMVAALGASACGTSQATVAMHFVGWK
mgnify:CR=1 FL=1